MHPLPPKLKEAEQRRRPKGRTPVLRQLQVVSNLAIETGHIVCYLQEVCQVGLGKYVPTSSAIEFLSFPCNYIIFGPIRMRVDL